MGCSPQLRGRPSKGLGISLSIPKEGQPSILHRLYSVMNPIFQDKETSIQSWVETGPGSRLVQQEPDTALKTKPGDGVGVGVGVSGTQPSDPPPGGSDHGSWPLPKAQTRKE